MSSGGSCIGVVDLGVGEQPLDPRRPRRAGGRAPSRAGCRSTGRSISCSLASSHSRPSRSRYCSSSLSLATQSSSAAHSIGSRSSRSSTDSQRASTSTRLRVGVGAVAVLDVLLGQVEVLQLELDRRERAAVAQRQRLLERRVVRHRAQRRDRAVDASSGSPRNRSSIIASTSDGRADLEVRRDLGEVGVADDHVQPAVLLRVGVRLVAGVDDRPLERRLEADLDLEEVGALADLEARRSRPSWPMPTRPAPADDLAADEERRQVPDDVGERRRAPHQVVLVGAVRRALVVGVVLVEHDRRAGRQQARRAAAASSMTCSPALSQRTTSSGVGHLGRGVLRVRVVDVEPGAVGEDDVGQAEVLVGELARVGDAAGDMSKPRASRSGDSSSKSQRAAAWPSASPLA